MMLLIGQPVWQNGMPQSMHRAPCVEASSSVREKMNSRELRTRSAIGSIVSATRFNSMKPVIFPMTLPSPSRSRSRLHYALRIAQHPVVGDSAAIRDRSPPFGPRRSRRCLLFRLRSGGLGGRLRRVHLGERATVFVRERLDELAPMGLPVVEHRERI